MAFNAKLLGKRINEQRKKLNISQEVLAEMIDKSVPMISYYGSGKRVPPPETLYKLAEILRVSTDYLLGLTDVPFYVTSDNVEKELKKCGSLEAENEELKEILVNIKKLIANS